MDAWKDEDFRDELAPSLLSGPVDYGRRLSEVADQAYVPEAVLRV